MSAHGPTEDAPSMSKAGSANLIALGGSNLGTTKGIRFRILELESYAVRISGLGST